MTPEPRPLWETTERFATVGELRRIARATMEVGLWNYLEGGSGDEWTLERNESSFKRWRFCPRMLTGITPPDVRTTVLGMSLSMPIVTAPFGFDSQFHPDGFTAVTRGAGSQGTAAIVPVISSRSLEEVRAAAPEAAQLFQVVAWGPEQPFVDLGRRAADAGYKVLVVTVDTSAPGWRERSFVDRWLPDGSAALGNFKEDPSTLARMTDFGDRMWTWEELGDRCAKVGLPWMPKGVLCGEDARAAVDAGAAGVFVSNHGGRQLEQAPAPLDVLPEVVSAIGGEAVVALDGGVRRGSDVLVALALGAQLVGIGRPTVWGLAAAGVEGVGRVLDLLRRELVVTMSLCGRASVAEVDETLVRIAS